MRGGGQGGSGVFVCGGGSCCGRSLRRAPSFMLPRAPAYASPPTVVRPGLWLSFHRIVPACVCVWGGGHEGRDGGRAWTSGRSGGRGRGGRALAGAVFARAPAPPPVDTHTPTSMQARKHATPTRLLHSL